jgi:CubicO group peptidase (beta-lactamase class C family)
MRSTTRFTAIALLLASPSMAEAEPSLTVEQRTALDSTLEDMRTKAHVPGLAVGIVDGGALVYSRGFGVRDLGSGAPVDTDTLFHVASISKTFTTAAVMQLIERGKLTLDDPVERHLPEFAGSGILVRHLLTHTAGLQDRERPTGSAESSAVNAYVTRVANRARAYPPGKGWEYSDADFNVLGALVEKVSDRTFCEYIEKQILAPAKLTHVSCRAPDAKGNIAWPHRGESTPQRAERHPWDRAFLPSSGIEASVTDVMRWSALHLARDPSLLKSGSYAALFEPRVETSWDGVSMGLGWQLEKRGETWLPRHPGGDPGFRALMTLYPSRGGAIVILSNGESTPRWELRTAIEKILGQDPR